MINPAFRVFLQICALVSVLVVLFLLFPAAFRFVEGAARSVVRLWWLILLLVLAVWLIWGVGRRPKK
jgi:hypothetical protein